MVYLGIGFLLSFLAIATFFIKGYRVGNNRHKNLLRMIMLTYFTCVIISLVIGSILGEGFYEWASTHDKKMLIVPALALLANTTVAMFLHMFYRHCKIDKQGDKNGKSI